MISAQSEGIFDEGPDHLQSLDRLKPCPLFGVHALELLE